ncbi:SOS response-associated peptidase [Rhodobacteraceae bacterium CCMM004]|nr:SOS response-associated peptidase [Rhodobacteraceae bacterium CCMM004]
MPGRLILTSSSERVAAALAAGGTEGIDAAPRRNIAPGQEIVVCPPGRRLTSMRWGLLPVGRVNARGRPVMETIVNARSETVFAKSAFAGVAGAVVPADGWYEWTGPARRKTRWRVESADGALLLFAAITDVWVAPGGAALPQVALVTCAPSPDVAEVHHRMGVLLAPEDVETWLTGSAEEAAPLMRPWPAGRLTVTEDGTGDLTGR